jgi:hypothetical protein
MPKSRAIGRPKEVSFSKRMSNARRTDPKQVHHAAHKQQRRHCPAAADAIRAMTKPKHQRARCVAAKAAMAYQERKWGLALGEA